MPFSFLWYFLWSPKKTGEREAANCFYPSKTTWSISWFLSPGGTSKPAFWGLLLLVLHPWSNLRWTSATCSWGPQGVTMDGCGVMDGYGLTTWKGCRGAVPFNIFQYLVDSSRVLERFFHPPFLPCQTCKLVIRVDCGGGGFARTWQMPGVPARPAHCMWMPGYGPYFLTGISNLWVQVNYNLWSTHSGL